MRLAEKVEADISPEATIFLMGIGTKATPAMTSLSGIRIRMASMMLTGKPVEVISVSSGIVVSVNLNWELQALSGVETISGFMTQSKAGIITMPI